MTKKEIYNSLRSILEGKYPDEDFELHLSFSQSRFGWMELKVECFFPSRKNKNREKGYFLSNGGYIEYPP